MKQNILLVFAAVLFSLMPACESNEDSIMDTTTTESALPSSMKGYELYSWKTDAQWNYTLITGTNRNKTYDEIVTADNIETTDWIKISVQDVNNLKKLLNRMPADESIFWINTSTRVAGFSLPQASVISQIEKQCNALDLNFEAVR